MTKSLTFTWGVCEMHISDTDEEKEIGISILDKQTEDENVVYLTEENIISLREHLDYIIAKF